MTTTPPTLSAEDRAVLYLIAARETGFTAPPAVFERRLAQLITDAKGQG